MRETDADREQEFADCQNTTWGWDGYHVEDAVSFACLFRHQRDEARAEVTAWRMLARGEVPERMTAALEAGLAKANARAAALADAWNWYGENATVTDGHTPNCTFREGLARYCDCGLSELEEAIRAIVRSVPVQRRAPT